MGGGLLQLSIEGQMNIPLFYNPRISFFSYAYKKHTNFAIENLTHQFFAKPGNILTMHLTEYTVLLPQDPNVDLLSNLYLVFKVPDIYSDDKLKFKWVENFGSLILKNAFFKIDDNTIDYITGEWLIVWNELSMPVKDGFNNMTGNIPELVNPRKKETTIRIRNNIVNEYDYASSSVTDINNNPSIKGRYITIPLPFWFSKNPSLALPILKFCTNHKISVHIEFENIENLYTVYSDIYNMHISPTYYKQLHNKQISFGNFAKDYTLTTHIEATYIVLDCYERQTIIDKATMEFLIETLKIKKDPVMSGGNAIRPVVVTSQLLVKEIIWTLNRADSIYKFNNICNYTYSIPPNNENSIMQSAAIVWDRASVPTRVEQKDSHFYNNIQPYQHHSTIPRQGIYCYSFSIFPEKWFPSGCYNASGVGTILSLKFNDYKPSLIDEIFMKKFNTNYKMDENNDDIIITVYTVQYNILVIMSGTIGLKVHN
jgi:hypothetical protein